MVSAPAVLTYPAIIVTDAAYVEPFARLARLHTLTGVPTRVVTVQEICAASVAGCHDGDGAACYDTAKAIKEYLTQAYASGLRHVVMGGDSTIVPSRQTSDFYVNLLMGLSYQRTFHTDTYFADLSEWDGNGDCVYGQPGVDAPDYVPELAVSRIPVASTGELAAYLAKVERYLTAYDTARIGTALLLSNVATQLSLGGDPVPIDSALYFESPGRTLSVLPSTFAVAKLYSLADGTDAQPISVAAQIAALERGTNLVIHAGHGGTEVLTVEYDGSQAFSAVRAYALANTQLPIMLSCACEAGDFAAGGAAAGRSFVCAPAGGGIGYLGNSTVGLGMGGGLQLIDEVLRHVFANPGALAGEAVRTARVNLPKSDSFAFSGVPVIGTVTLPIVDENAWRWTQKSATYLGDGLLPVYTDPALAAGPSFAVTTRRQGHFVIVTWEPAAAVSGTLTVELAGAVYRISLAGDGGPVSLTVAGEPRQLAYGFASPTTLAAYQEMPID